MKFKVGDRVKFDTVVTGEGTGTIVETHEPFFLFPAGYGVKSDKKIAGGHDLSGKVEDGYGFLIFEDDLTLIDEKEETETIVIYRDGNKVVALDKRDGRKVGLESATDEEADFDECAKMALEQLLNEKEEPKYLNAKIVFTESHGDKIIKGKIYEIKDGFITLDNSISVFPVSRNDGFKNIQEVKRYFSEDGMFSSADIPFIEVVE